MGLLKTPIGASEFMTLADIRSRAIHNFFFLSLCHGWTDNNYIQDDRDTKQISNEYLHRE